MALNSTDFAILLYKAGEFNEAIQLLKEASKYGEAAASFYLGKCLAKGQGITSDLVEALLHFKVAANAGIEGAFALYCQTLIVAVDESASKYFPTELSIHFKCKTEFQSLERKIFDYFDRQYKINNNLKFNTSLKVILSLFYYFGVGTSQNQGMAENLLGEASYLGNIEASYLLGKLFNKSENLLSAANSNHPQACVDVGVLYINGNGVQKNNRVAQTWYRKAADLGHAGGAFYLASSLLLDSSENADKDQIIRLMKKSADLGHPSAIYNYGTFLEMGKDLPQDVNRAFEFYKKGAELGVPESIFKVGFCMLNGKGTLKNPEESAQYFKCAADLGNKDAAFNYGIQLELGKVIKRNSSQAAKYYQIAADLGDSMAIVNLGGLYERGDGVTQDLAKAVNFYLQAAEKGNPTGLHNYAVMLENGLGIAKNELKAIKLYKIAADMGEPRSMFNHANSLLLGRGFQKNVAEAAKYYKMSADLGFNHGMMNTAIAYLKGVGFPQDYVKALEYFKKAFASGISDAQEGINVCLAKIKVSV